VLSVSGVTEAVWDPGGSCSYCDTWDMHIGGVPKVGLGADDLKYPLEVPVTSDQNEVVFEYQRCNPKIVVRHGRTGSP